ncbi:MAG TPA: hypothetical protein VHI78_02090 [Bacteroidales bacterium]|jgi:hypothetical protein|nr:hypothetical protein [Bacteroidales bacterium]
MNQGLSRNFLFWQKWLLYSSLMLALAGLIITFPDPNPLLDGYKKLLTRDLFGGSQLENDAGRLVFFIRGPFGATICCTYVLLAYIAAYPFKRKEKWSRNAIIIAFGLWFVVDTLFCLSYNMYFHAGVLNSLSLLQKALPVIFTWKEFNDKSRQE